MQETRVTRHRSWSVGELFERRPDHRLNFAAEETSQSADDLHLCLPRRSLDLLNVLPRLVTQSLWKSVGEVLKRGDVANPLIWWVAEIASLKADDSDFCASILPRFSIDQLITVLPRLVTRRMWKSVGEVFKRGAVPLHLMWWAVEKASQAANDKDFYDHILFYCIDYILDKVLATLVRRGMWQSVREVSKKSAAPWQALDDFFDEGQTSVPPGCDLQTLVSQRKWKSIGKELESKSVDVQHWALEKACMSAEDKTICKDIIPYCHNEAIKDTILTILVCRRLWKSLYMVLTRATGDRQRRLLHELISIHFSIYQDGIPRGKESTWFTLNILTFCSQEQSNSILTTLLTRCPSKRQNYFIDLSNSEVLPIDVSDQSDKESNVKDWFCNNNISSAGIFHPASDKELKVVVMALVLQCQSRLVEEVLETAKKLDNLKKQGTQYITNMLRLDYDIYSYICFKDIMLQLRVLVGRQLWSLLYKFLDLNENSQRVTDSQLLDTIQEFVKSKNVDSGDLVHYASKMCVHRDFIEFILQTPNDCNVQTLVTFFVTYGKWYCGDSPLPFKILVSFTEAMAVWALRENINFNERYANGGIVFESPMHRLMAILSLTPLFQDVQSVLLRSLLDANKWDVINMADLTHVWEEVRRELFQAAVKQGQWTVVKQWADHSLYRDQRFWAMREARRHNQWDVYLQLADHGLTEDERARAHCNVFEYADWPLLISMLNNGVDIRNVINSVKKVKNKKTKRRFRMLKYLQKAFNSNSVCTYVHQCCAGIGPLSKKYQRNKCLSSFAALDLDTGNTNKHFRHLTDHPDWGTSLKLLENGVDVSDWSSLLQQLLNHGQWMLVARIMEEYDVDDSVRRHVMKKALERREGSVVCHCIKTLKQSLSVEDRQELFNNAFSKDMWQALKPLVEIKDTLGYDHRDTVMKHAVHHRQWNVVLHCQVFLANINEFKMSSYNYLQKAALKGDWETVEELICRGCDINTLFLNLLQMAFSSQKRNIIELMIKHHQRLYSDDEEEREILENLWPAEMFDLALYWCPDVCYTDGRTGVTPLHKVCLNGQPETLYFLVARGAKPLAVTREGESALMCAVRNKTCPQRIVAECIRMGLSTHQPKLTLNWWRRHDITDSPIMHAAEEKMPVICIMLYESGACSNYELFLLKEKLKDREATANVTGTWAVREKRQNWFAEPLVVQYLMESWTEQITKYVCVYHYITKVATTPRTLKSLCRLVISHAFNVRGKRHKEVKQLHSLPPSLIDYILFSDLTDPTFGSQPDFLNRILEQ